MAQGIGYKGGRQAETGSAPGVGRLNWNGAGEGVKIASLPASGWFVSSTITGVGFDPPNALEQAESVSNKDKLASIFLKFIVSKQSKIN